MYFMVTVVQVEVSKGCGGVKAASKEGVSVVQVSSPSRMLSHEFQDYWNGGQIARDKYAQCRVKARFEGVKKRGKRLMHL